jgi:hypothetical protein
MLEVLALTAVAGLAVYLVGVVLGRAGKDDAC